MVQLDKTDLELLIILQEKPTANDSTLARLVNLSSPTIKRRIDRLYDLGAIERIQAILNYEALNLKIVSVFLSIPHQKIKIVQEQLTNHQFIYYHVRCVGFHNGIHATFRIPEKDSNLLSFLQELKDSGNVTDFSFFVHKEEIRNKPQFIKYDSRKNEWDYNFSQWVGINTERFHEIDEPISTEAQVSLADLDLIDVQILSILSLNSRIKNVNILKALNKEISPQRLSDRLRFLRRNFISNYRVYLNWNDIFSFMGLLFDCTASEDKIEVFKQVLRIYPAPFETIFRRTKEGFLLYLVCPPNHVYPAIDALFEYCIDVKHYILEYTSAIRVPLKYKYYNSQSKSWFIQ